MFATANIYRTSGTSTNDVNDKMFTMGRVRGFTIKKKRKWDYFKKLTLMLMLQTLNLYAQIQIFYSMQCGKK